MLKLKEKGFKLGTLLQIQSLGTKERLKAGVLRNIFDVLQLLLKSALQAGFETV